MSQNPSSTLSQSITFLRSRDYRLVRELGHGACGRTVLLHDDIIDEQFVCKKYHPTEESHRQELFASFVREIKLLHRLQHINVVRIFNYYLYPHQYLGYILMEFVDGANIQEYLANHPEESNELFLQAICGFQYLEEAGVLHRDIRPQNIMVTVDGVLKIIDLGFGKRVANSADFEKSISLNWWCEPPDEFDNDRYDFSTEVYFVGKLFQKIIRDNDIEHFHYSDLLRQMCERSPDRRIRSFAVTIQSVRSNRFSEISFEDSDLNTYRDFAATICEHITKIEHTAEFIDDIARIERELSDAYRSFMLERTVPDAVLVTRCFIEGTYYYRKSGFPVARVKEFLNLLKSSSQEQGRIILANLHTKLCAIERYVCPVPPPDDEIPF